jgi:hypothetical protein
MVVGDLEPTRERRAPSVPRSIDPLDTAHDETRRRSMA